MAALHHNNNKKRIIKKYKRVEKDGYSQTYLIKKG